MDQPNSAPSTLVKTFRFSTDELPAHNRQAHWYELMRRRIVGLDHQPFAGHTLSHSVGMVLPTLGIVAANTGRIRVSRTRETMLDGNDNVRLVILQRSRTSAPATQLGRDLTVEPGGAVALSNCDLNAITFPEPSKLLALNMTRKMLRPLLRDFDMVLGRVIPKQVGPLRLLASYIEAVLNQPAPPTAEFSQLITAHTYDLAALTMGATRDAAELASSRGVRAARLRAIKSDVRANLHRDGLSIEQIARSHRVSPRYVQMLFAEEGITFTEFVLNGRLARAHQMLSNPWFADRSISSIAFEVGFNDLSYFNKTFRRRFESTPSDVRATIGGVPASSRAQTR